jgi:hypothetical protein
LLVAVLQQLRAQVAVVAAVLFLTAKMAGRVAVGLATVEQVYHLMAVLVQQIKVLQAVKATAVLVIVQVVVAVVLAQLAVMLQQVKLVA